MTTLIQTGQPGSPCYRRCDARCHYARFSICDCVCGGRYHGRGSDGSLVATVHETGDQFVDYLESQGCDVTELRAAKKGELAEQLEAERRAWLARRPGARMRGRRPAARRGRARDERQGRLDFGALGGILGCQRAAPQDGLCEEISDEEDGQAAGPGRGAAARQDGAEGRCPDNG